MPSPTAGIHLAASRTRLGQINDPARNSAITAALASSIKRFTQPPTCLCLSELSLLPLIACRFVLSFHGEVSWSQHLKEILVRRRFILKPKPCLLQIRSGAMLCGRGERTDAAGDGVGGKGEQHCKQQDRISRQGRRRVGRQRVGWRQGYFFVDPTKMYWNHLRDFALSRLLVLYVLIHGASGHKYTWMLFLKLSFYGKP